MHKDGEKAKFKVRMFEPEDSAAMCFRTRIRRDEGPRMLTRWPGVPNALKRSLRDRGIELAKEAAPFALRGEELGPFAPAPELCHLFVMHVAVVTSAAGK